MGSDAAALPAASPGRPTAAASQRFRHSVRFAAADRPGLRKRPLPDRLQPQSRPAAERRGYGVGRRVVTFSGVAITAGSTDPAVAGCTVAGGQITRRASEEMK